MLFILSFQFYKQTVNKLFIVSKTKGCSKLCFSLLKKKVVSKTQRSRRFPSADKTQVCLRQATFYTCLFYATFSQYFALSTLTAVFLILRLYFCMLLFHNVKKQKKKRFYMLLVSMSLITFKKVDDKAQGAKAAALYKSKTIAKACLQS